MAYLHRDHIHYIPSKIHLNWSRLAIFAALVAFWVFVAAPLIR